MNSIIIKKLGPTAQDSRGSTWEWCRGIDGKQVTVYERIKGYDLSENHYHKGNDPSKNPERFLLLNGRAKLTARTVYGANFTVELTPLTDVIIYPDVLHSIEPLTKKVLFAEYRCTEFNSDRSDCYSPESFEEYKKEVLERERKFRIAR